VSLCLNLFLFIRTGVELKTFILLNMYKLHIIVINTTFVQYCSRLKKNCIYSLHFQTYRNAKVTQIRNLVHLDLDLIANIFVQVVPAVRIVYF
jgi:hypothetical protein